jgi:carboxypeptidase C (cathepsin A)
VNSCSQVDNQVGGYATVYSVPNATHNFQFVTVKGSGHMVPQYQPALALAMLTRYINDTAF